ncbi:hypothetical protein QTP88_026486 [Uroleucon formosanum]
MYISNKVLTIIRYLYNYNSTTIKFSISNGEKRFFVGKKDELAGDKSRALAVFLGDLNSSSEFGDGELESS